jgi:hypothetical protein
MEGLQLLLMKSQLEASRLPYLTRKKMNEFFASTKIITVGNSFAEPEPRLFGGAGAITRCSSGSKLNDTYVNFCLFLKSWHAIL